MSRGRSNDRPLTPDEAGRALLHMRGILLASALWICIGVGWCAALSAALAPWLIAFAVLYGALWLPLVLRMIERDIERRTTRSHQLDIAP